MKNKVKILKDCAIIYAREGEEIIVDKERVYDLASDYKWYINSKNGEPTTNKKINGTSYRIKMKHLLTNTFKVKKLVYYKNKNPLDNRITNLTFCNNDIIIYNDYAVIKSTDNTDKDFLIKIDLEDVDKVKQFSWSAHWKGYLFRRENRKNIYLHNFLMDISDEDKTRYIDHIDRDPTNNRKENLRICTNNQNAYNKGKVFSEKYTSKYKGVSWDKKRECWKVGISYNKKALILGYYQDEIVAANIYNHYAKLYHGEFAVLNKVPYVSLEESKKFEYIRKNNSYTKLTGITYRKYSGKWIACFRYKGKYIHIGSFDNELDAARAYNNKILEMGINRKLNNI